MILKLLARATLGIIFAALGYYLGQTFLSNFNPAGYPFLVQTLLSITLVVVGLASLPMLSHYLNMFYTNLVQKVASELVNQIQSRLPNTSRSKEKKAQISDKTFNPMLVDTSAIIDGRLLDIVETGFLAGTLLVPEFVLSELQQVSDSSNSLKRGRGRRGFDILESLKKSKNAKTQIIKTNENGTKEADDRLVKLAKILKAKIITCDYNLNKVASLSGVKILNVNELANSLKTVVLPGETLNVKLIQEGKEKNQAVGYLPDGTMIVVERAGGMLGKTLDVSVSRVIQTVAGRMIFAMQKDK